MIRPLLLDTCAALWSIEPGALHEKAEALIQATVDSGVPIYLSPITAWEVGLLISRGRLRLPTDPRLWFRGLLDAGYTLAPLDAGILLDSSFLPDSPLRDPADRILVATARAMQCPIVTRDRLMMDYAAIGQLKLVPC